MKVSPGCISAIKTSALAEEPRVPLDAKVLRSVDKLQPAVIAPARRAFGGFVSQDRALGLKHGAADDVFRGDQLDLVALTTKLAADGIGDFGIAFRERGGEKSLDSR